ncbi:MAG: aspartate/glutamate racemase family protein [Methanocella sp.]
MKKTVAVVHTGPVTIQPLKEAFLKALPEARVINLMDDSLLNDALAAGRVTKAVAHRMLSYFLLAQGMGVDVILNACSSVGETVDLAQSYVTTPILKIDAPMAEDAVRLGKVVTVVATVPTTLDPTVRLIERKAVEAGKAVEIRRALVDGAFTQLLAGKPEDHDSLVSEAILKAARESDAVVLAQVSMARLLKVLAPGDLPAPVLTSLDKGVLQVKEFFQTARGER